MDGKRRRVIIKINDFVYFILGNISCIYSVWLEKSLILWQYDVIYYSRYSKLMLGESNTIELTMIIFFLWFYREL